MQTNDENERARDDTKKKADSLTLSLVKRTLRIMLTAMVLLLVFNASALQRYIADLPPSPVTEELLLLAENWTSFTEDMGAAKLLESVREKMLEITEEKL